MCLLYFENPFVVQDHALCDSLRCGGNRFLLPTVTCCYVCLMCGSNLVCGFYVDLFMGLGLLFSVFSIDLW